MKMRRFTIIILLILTVAITWPSAVYAKELRDDEVVFGGTFTLNEGEVLEGNLIVLAGTARVEEGATVEGDVVLVGGTVTLGGTVTGTMVGIGGSIRLSDSALIEGDLTVIAATLNRTDGARVNGEVITGLDGPLTLNFPGEIQAPDSPRVPSFNVNFNPLVDFVWTIFRMFIWALLAVLTVMIFPTQTERVAESAIKEPVTTAGAGLITAILAPFALIALSLTIILIPVTFLASLALAVIWAFGQLAIGLEVGRRIAKQLNQDWAPAITAGVGTLVLMFVLIGFDALVPCIGWVPRMIVSLWAMGAVLMTRIGSQEYPTAAITTVTEPDEIPSDGLNSDDSEISVEENY